MAEAISKISRKWAAILVLILAISALGLVAIQQYHARALSEATDSIYTIVLEQHVRDLGEGPKPEVLVFRSTTVPLPCFEDNEARCPELIKKSLEAAFPKLIDRDTIKDTIARNQSSFSLSTTFHSDLPLILLNQEDLNSYFVYSKKHDFWNAFYEKNPTAGGIRGLSKVGFNSEGDQALVYSQNSCGGLCGGGFYDLLKKENGKWVLISRFMAWVS